MSPATFGLALLFSAPAAAQSPPIPDPPGLIHFKNITLKTVAPAKVTVPDTCDPLYRNTVENRFLNLWKKCEPIGKKEPSQCQRELFSACTDLANKTRSLPPASCAAFASRAGGLAKPAKEEDQASSQGTNSLLQQKTAEALRANAATLKGDLHQVSVLREKLKKSWGGPACAAISARKIYEGAVSEAMQEAAALEGDLGRLAEIKEQEAKGHERAETESQSNQVGMTSAGVAKTSKNDLPSAGTSGSPKYLVPVAAAAIAAPLVLAGLSASGKDETSLFVSGSESAPTGSAPSLASTDFTDRERAIIRAGLESLPECHRERAAKVPVFRANLGSKSGGCIAGEHYFGRRGEKISFNPACGLTVGVAVHEYMHSIGRKNVNRLYTAYQPIYRKHRAHLCPASKYVSLYGSTSTALREDFAEAGRFGFASGEISARGGCVGEKVAEHKKLLLECR